MAHLFPITHYYLALFMTPPHLETYSSSLKPHLYFLSELKASVMAPFKSSPLSQAARSAATATGIATPSPSQCVSPNPSRKRKAQDPSPEGRVKRLARQFEQLAETNKKENTKPKKGDDPDRPQVEPSVKRRRRRNSVEPLRIWLLRRLHRQTIPGCCVPDLLTPIST